LIFLKCPIIYYLLVDPLSKLPFFRGSILDNSNIFQGKDMRPGSFSFDKVGIQEKAAVIIKTGNEVLS